MTSKEMRELVATARSYERGKLWMEKTLKLEHQLENLKKMGGNEEWLREQTRLLERQRARAQYLWVVGKQAHERLEELMGQISQEHIYQILSRHYLKGQTWEHIALSLGGNTADSVRKAATRYLSRLD